MTQPILTLMFAFIVYFDMKPKLKEKRWREVIFTGALLLLGYIIMIAGTLETYLLNPLNAFNRFFQSVFLGK